jgi:threonine/homoserine/homoserine lactone efflux protein
VIGFLAVAVVVIVAPGPDFALTVKNSVRGGGVATALGVVKVVARGAAMLLVPRVRRIVDVVTGVVLVALGLRLATEGR